LLIVRNWDEHQRVPHPSQRRNLEEDILIEVKELYEKINTENGQESIEAHDGLLRVSCSKDKDKEKNKDKEKKKEEEDSAEPKTKQKPEIPTELVGLSLYETDMKLHKQWPQLLPAWKEAYPGVNILSETRKAHAWEISNPSKQKKNRARSLANWLARAQDQPGRPGQSEKSDFDGVEEKIG